MEPGPSIVLFWTLNIIVVLHAHYQLMAGSPGAGLKQTYLNITWMKAFRSAKFFELSSGVAKFNSTLKFFKSIVHPIFEGIIAIDLPFPDDIR